MADKEHKYPKIQSTDMKKVQTNVLGGSKKATTESGPHLKQGKGTPYNQAKITSGFLAQNPRPGHKQKGNLEGKDKS